MTVSTDTNAKNARRTSNYTNAIMLVRAGVAIIPSDDKYPLVKAFTRLDDEIPADEKAAIRSAALAKRGMEPVHIGATRREATVRKLWHRFPDATPSIAPGPNGLIVVDPDRKNNGPKQFAEFCEANGGLPEGAVCIPTRDGGQHWYFKNPEGLGSSAGKLGALGCDVKGATGQVVAPGSIREDGTTYGTKDDLLRFVQAFKADSLPELPGFIRAAIGAVSAAPLSDSDPAVKAALERLAAVEWPEFDDVFDATLGKYDIQALALDNMEFAELYREPSDDRSRNRFLAARHLMREWPKMPVEDLAAFFAEWEGAGDLVDDAPSSGEFNNRQIAREWVKNQGLSKPSKGEAFGAVDDEGDEPANKPKGQLPFEFESDVAASAVLPDWLIGEIIEAETLCVIYGAPNSGKSLAVLDMLYHVATGKPWRGRDVKQGSVLYISVEGPNGTARRAKAWREHHGVADGESLPLAFIRVDVDLFNDRKAAKAIVDAVALLESMTGLPCRAVAIDTVNAVTPGMDENSSADVGVFLRNLRTILAGTNATVMPVHHTGKDESRGMRGSNALLAKAETTLLVSDGVLSTVKMRDGQRGQRFPFTIKILNLWTDDKGRPVGAPIVIEPERGASLDAVADDDEAIPSPPDTPADKLTATLRALEECAAEQAEITGDAVTEIGVTKGQVFARLNRDRKSAGLPVLKDPTIATRLLDKLVKSEQAVRVGANRRTEYRVVD